MDSADEKQAQRARLTWVRMYEETKDAGLTCRRCGISRPTLRKWWTRFQSSGEVGLCSESRKRLHLPEKKVTLEREELILRLRKERKIGAKSLQSELERHHGLKLSTATIWEVLHRHKVALLRKPKIPEVPLRYSRPLPGDRIQMDTCKVGKNLFQFTAVDDCTRLRVLGVYPARTAKNGVDFLVERVIEGFPFPIQRIQTDRGGEFFGEEFQEALRENCIKFRPIRPRTPHLNGKVERAQQTDKIEFWATADKTAADLQDRLGEWQHYYNWHRPHTSLNGKTPMDRYFELIGETPYSWEVDEQYDEGKQPSRVRDHSLDQRLRDLK